jgi:hypothetical protein
MSTTAISVDEDQLQILRRGSLLLPMEVRSWFLEATATRLGGTTEPTDADLQNAVIGVLESVKIPVPIDLFERAIPWATSGGCIGLPLKEPVA